MSEKHTGTGRTQVTGLFALIGLGFVLLLIAFSSRNSDRVDPYRENDSGTLVGEVIQVSVRNGCGVSGLAGELTHYLRQQGFDVVEVGDHTSFDLEQSMVYDRIGDLESARKLAVAVGLPEDRVFQDIDPEEYLDATIVIGKDYEHLTPFKTLSQTMNQ